jgi:CRISPR/Cas system CMR-associated protein Cmr3 (group 5 of RAMP superfamily)
MGVFMYRAEPRGLRLIDKYKVAMITPFALNSNPQQSHVNYSAINDRASGNTADLHFQH